MHLDRHEVVTADHNHRMFLSCVILNVKRSEVKVLLIFVF